MTSGTPVPLTASPTQTESLLQHFSADPHSSGPTLLIRSASFSYRMQSHAHPTIIPSPPPLVRSNISRREISLISPLTHLKEQLWEMLLGQRWRHIKTTSESVMENSDSISYWEMVPSRCLSLSLSHTHTHTPLSSTTVTSNTVGVWGTPTIINHVWINNPVCQTHTGAPTCAPGSARAC